MSGLVTLLDRAPSPLRRLAYRIASGQGVLGRVVDAVRFRFTTADIPRVPMSSDEPVRLLIGPANTAGQGYQWMRAVERNFEDVAATSVQGIGEGVFRARVDLRVPIAVYRRSPEWHTDFERYLGEQTHIVWESGLPLLGQRYASSVTRELMAFRSRGIQGALLFHGSDIRPPSRHAESSRWSPFDSHAGPVRVLEETAARNLALAESSGIPVFVSTPDLLRWLPDATWCPVSVDPALWRERAIDHAPGEPPVVAHAPSQRWLKGTDLIEPVLRRLAAERVIEYRPLMGVPHDEMPKFYAEADIVLDQFVLGIYGVAACEAMAAGKLVMSHVDEFTRCRVRESTGWDLPVHEVTVETLESELRRAAADPEAFAGLREAGPRFVEAVHDGRRSAAAFGPFLGLSA